MFDDFALHTVAAADQQFRVRVGGTGAPVLLLHGHPQTHVMWHRVAPALAERFALVIPDLPGYGRSTGRPSTLDSSAHSKRTMARDLVALMREFGHERFAVVGHDRGGRVAYRMALDHPDRVAALVVLDIVPTADMWRYAQRDGKEFGATNWHWFFLARPVDLPEQVILAAPERFYFTGDTGHFAPDALADYFACVADAATVHALCEDYRAGAGIDHELDEADRAAGRRITCPVLALWSAREELPRWFDVLEVWRTWADDVRGHGIDSGHYLAEEAPDAVASALAAFLADSQL
jgi:haloacetate dehalogenase